MVMLVHAGQARANPEGHTTSFRGCIRYGPLHFGRHIVPTRASLQSTTNRHTCGGGHHRGLRPTTIRRHLNTTVRLSDANVQKLGPSDDAVRRDDNCRGDDVKHSTAQHSTA
ncbi:hypothetical protein CSOJ01_01290 [Colletotrichum sojae]|uniref:Uncharacterized protein n=1 Tax=Colletotrichum sojae TaxID=2175907 RepID=A0A8H6JUW3_9PEZI|nr:hypothetical protein CSOJ01_01290 [Colletotrichum sojae]